MTPHVLWTACTVRAKRCVLLILRVCHRITGRPRHHFYCPACDSPVLGWQAFYRYVGLGKVQREPGGRLCPFCNSFERTRHFILYVEKQDLLKNDPMFLDFAPHTKLAARFSKQLASHYITTDLTEKSVDINQDMTSMIFRDNLFDLIYCSNVLEHVDDDRKAMHELCRILKPGGLAIIQVPIKGDVTDEDPTITSPDERAIRFGQGDHVRYYGLDVADRLTEAGFEVKVDTMLNLLQLGRDDVEKYNLSKEEPIHFCSKPTHSEPL